MKRVNTKSTFARYLALSLLLTITTANAQNTDTEVNRRTTAGVEVLIRAHAEWDTACGPLQPPAITVVEAPQHGTVELRPGNAPLGKNYIGGTDCTGHTGPGTQVIYQPSASFQGTDSFTYEIHYHQTGKVRSTRAFIRIR